MKEKFRYNDSCNRISPPGTVGLINCTAALTCAGSMIVLTIAPERVSTTNRSARSSGENSILCRSGTTHNSRLAQ